MSMLERLLRPLLIRWLRKRALVIPGAVRDRIAKELRVRREVVDAIHDQLQESIIKALFDEKA